MANNAKDKNNNLGIKVANTEADPPGTVYRCTMCGRFYKTQFNHFYKTRSPLYDGNHGYTCVCKECVNNYYYHLIDVFDGDTAKAVEGICSAFDIYFSEEICSQITERSTSASAPVFAKYLSKVFTMSTKDGPIIYSTTIGQRDGKGVQDVEKNEAEKTEAELELQRSTERWGPGFETDEYPQLDSHYKFLKKLINDDDAVQETYIRDLCVTKVLQNRAVKTNDSEAYAKFTKLYQDSLKNANLKPKEELDSDNDTMCWGIVTQRIEEHTPAEIYKTKLFDDYDDIKSYFNRFIVRPFKNFFTGSNEMDEEFSIKVGDEGGDV